MNGSTAPTCYARQGVCEYCMCSEEHAGRLQYHVVLASWLHPGCTDQVNAGTAQPSLGGAGGSSCKFTQDREASPHFSSTLVLTRSHVQHSRIDTMALTTKDTPHTAKAGQATALGGYDQHIRLCTRTCASAQGELPSVTVTSALQPQCPVTLGMR